MIRTLLLTGFTALVAVATISLAPPAHAQIGNIFSDQPRPPGSVPRGGQQQAVPDDEEEVPELPRGRLLPTPNRPLPGQGVPPPGSVTSQPLPPPPGTSVVPQNPQAPWRRRRRNPVRGNPTRVSRLRRLASTYRPARRSQQKGVPPAPATLQPGDEVVTEPPAQKIVNKKASFSGLDKITGRIINFDEDIGETVQFGALRVKTDACYTRPPPRPPTPTPLSRSTKSPCRAK